MSAKLRMLCILADSFGKLPAAFAFFALSALNADGKTFNIARERLFLLNDLHIRGDKDLRQSRFNGFQEIVKFPVRTENDACLQ